MMEFTSAQVLAVFSAYFWPLARILGLFSSAPFFGHRNIPVRIRVAVGVAITFLIAPTLPTFTAPNPMSWQGLLILCQQILIGVSIGFTMRLIFTGVELTGDMIGMTMGFGFALFYNPQSGGQSSAINQLLSALTLLIFLAADIHLQLLQCLIKSYSSIPIDMTSLSKNMFQQVAILGKHIFLISFQLSMPVIAALLMINMALGVLTKAAPQLNLFGIGFPIILLVGFLMLALLMPYWAIPIHENLQHGINLILELISIII